MGPVVSRGSAPDGPSGSRSGFVEHDWKGGMVEEFTGKELVQQEPDASSFPSGQTKGIQFWGSSFVAGPQGEILYQASKSEEENAVIEVDMKRSENVRRWWPFLRDRRIEEFHDLAKRFIDESSCGPASSSKA